MRIQGEADNVYFFDADDKVCKLAIGDNDPLEEGKPVKGLFAIAEACMVLLKITYEDNSIRLRTVINEKVGICWRDTIELQSATEWSAWLAEAFARQYKLPMDLFPKHLQKWIKDPKKAAQDGAIPWTPDAAPITSLAPVKQPASSAPRQVDADAGGPPGLSMEDTPAPVDFVVEAIVVKLFADKVDAAGNRILTVVGNETLGVEIRMAKAVIVNGKKLPVEAVEFGEELGQEVLYIRLKKGA